jgi:hypothetical protein
VGEARASESTPGERLHAYERSFRRAGLPHFSEDFSAGTDIFNRALPLLVLVFVGQMLAAIEPDWEWWQNVLAVLGGLAILLAGFAALNRMRGRPLTAVPERVGKTELAGFVLIPALVPLIFGTHPDEVGAVIAGNLLFLGLVYAFGTLGLVPITRWVLGRLAAQVRSALPLIANAVPLLAIFALLSFTTEELWKIFTDMEIEIYFVVIGLFAALGTVFLLARIPREARRLEQEAGEGSPPLKRRQLLNVGLVMLVSQALQVLIVSVMIGVFFVVFGMLAIDDAIQTEWLGHPVDELLTIELFGEPLELTAELLRVAGGLAAFSGFYFAISMLTDSTYREEFLEELTSEMRDSFRERAEYLRLRDRVLSASAVPED